MFDIQVEAMMEAGAHFGHQTKRWNPKMKPFLFGIRSGVHIIDLQKTQTYAVEALEFIQKSVQQGLDVLFVGTKPQARDIIKTHVTRSNMFYVTDRWMGGTLTNFQTIKKSIDRLIDLETRRENNDFEGYTKRELLDIDRTVEKLEASLGGIKKLKKVPGVLVVIDPKQEKIAIQEANKLGIPVVALTDSNCDPDPIDYVIPANDDAISSIEYFVSRIADVCLEAYNKRDHSSQHNVNFADPKPARKPAPKRKPAAGKKAQPDNKKAFVAKGAEEQKFEGNAAEGYSATAEAPKTEA